MEKQHNTEHSTLQKQKSIYFKNNFFGPYFKISVYTITSAIKSNPPLFTTDYWLTLVYFTKKKLTSTWTFAFDKWKWI